MRLVACLAAAALLSGACTIERVSQLPPDELRTGIRSGALVQPGDSIGVVTVDGIEHALVVSSADAEAIRGASPAGDVVEVPIGQIVALRTRVIEPVGTTFAAIGVAALAGVLAMAYAFANSL